MVLSTLIEYCSRSMAYSLRSGDKRSISSTLAHQAASSLGSEHSSIKPKILRSASASASGSSNSTSTRTSSSSSCLKSKAGKTTIATRTKAGTQVSQSFFADGTKGLDIGCLGSQDLLINFAPCKEPLTSDPTPR